MAGRVFIGYSAATCMDFKYHIEYNTVNEACIAMHIIVAVMRGVGGVTPHSYKKIRFSEGKFGFFFLLVIGNWPAFQLSFNKSSDVRKFWNSVEKIETQSKSVQSEELFFRIIN